MELKNIKTRVLLATSSILSMVVVRADPTQMTQMLPPYKPSYLWTGDSVEELTEEDFNRLDIHRKLGYVSNETLQLIRRMVKMNHLLLKSKLHLKP